MEKSRPAVVRGHHNSRGSARARRPVPAARTCPSEVKVNLGHSQVHTRVRPRRRLVARQDVNHPLLCASAGKAGRGGDERRGREGAAPRERVQSDRRPSQSQAPHAPMCKLVRTTARTPLSCSWSMDCHACAALRKRGTGALSGVHLPRPAAASQPAASVRFNLAAQQLLKLELVRGDNVGERQDRVAVDGDEFCPGRACDTGRVSVAAGAARSDRCHSAEPHLQEHRICRCLPARGHRRRSAPDWPAQGEDRPRRQVQVRQAGAKPASATRATSVGCASAPP